MVAVFVFGLALLASRHLQHVVGALPYLLLLACPLMHFFGHGHHHAHKHAEASRSVDVVPQPSTEDRCHDQ
jgi:hypothetical protein